MSFFSRMKYKYSENRPLIYDEGLRLAYSTVSVCGGTLRGKTAVVTGATGGIGRAIVQRLLDEGASVIITGRSDEKLKCTAESLRKNKTTNVYSIVLDQSNLKSLKQGVDDAFGLCSINLWINCAGIFKDTDRDRIFRGVSADTYFDVINTNLRSTIMLTKLVADRMILQGTGTCQIINIASICGLTNHYGYTPYGISKTGVIEYTRLLAEKYLGEVIIEAVAPGSVATRMGAKQLGCNISGNNALTNHVALPEETAAVVCFMASHLGKYFNGQTIVASAAEQV